MLESPCTPTEFQVTAYTSDLPDSISRVVTVASAAHQAAYDRFEDAAREVVAGGTDKQNATCLDNYGIPQSYGGTVLLVITQNVLRIAELRQFLVRLGVENLPEGDTQEWEHFAGLIDAWGGQYPEGLVKPWANS